MCRFGDIPVFHSDSLFVRSFFTYIRLESCRSTWVRSEKSVTEYQKKKIQ